MKHILTTAFLLLGLALATPAQANDRDDIRQARDMLPQMVRAFEGGNLELAEDLAGQILELDPSAGTWRARRVLIEISEARGLRTQAVRRLEEWVAIDWPFEELTSWGENRLAALTAVTPERQAVQLRRRNAAIIMGVGAAPLAFGIGAIANYNYNVQTWESYEGNEDDIEAGLGPSDKYGGWAAIGVPFLAAGIAVEVIGAVMLVQTLGQDQPRVSPAPGPGQVGAGLTVSF